MSEFKHLIRIFGKDIDGKKKVTAALSDLKGVGPNLANMILNSLRIDRKLRFGALSDEQISEIETSLKNLTALSMPSWVMNRRKNIDTGSDTHIIAADLQITLKKDIDLERSVGSWRGIRHSLGLKVRGQRTRCTGRKGRSVGVRKTVRAPSKPS